MFKGMHDAFRVFRFQGPGWLSQVCWLFGESMDDSTPPQFTRSLRGLDGCDGGPPSGCPDPEPKTVSNSLETALKLSRQGLSFFPGCLKGNPMEIRFPSGLFLSRFAPRGFSGLDHFMGWKRRGRQCTVRCPLGHVATAIFQWQNTPTYRICLNTWWQHHWTSTFLGWYPDIHIIFVLENDRPGAPFFSLFPSCWSCTTKPLWAFPLQKFEGTASRWLLFFRSRTWMKLRLVILRCVTC